MKSSRASFQDHHKHKEMMKCLGFANEACVNVNSARRISDSMCGARLVRVSVKTPSSKYSWLHLTKYISYFNASAA